MWEKPLSVLPLQSDQVHLWWVDLDHFSDHIGDSLSKDELLRARKFRFEKDRQGYVAGRSALRALLGVYLETDASDLKFEYGEQGKPFVHNSYVNFNLSNSNEVAVIGFSRDIPIGVDVEWIKPENQFPLEEMMLIARRFFSQAEFKKLAALDPGSKRKAFFECWTRKESFIKADGSGLSFPLDQFEVSFGPDKDPGLLFAAWDKAEPLKWSIHAFACDTYVGASAVKGKIREWKTFRYDPSGFVGA